MEWLVPARIAPLRFLAYNTMQLWKREHIIRHGEAGAEVLQKVKDEVKASVKQGTPSKDRFTVGHITYETSIQKKVGGFIVYRKRVKCSKSVQGRKKIRLLVEEESDE